MKVGLLLLAHDISKPQIERATSLKILRSAYGPVLRFVLDEENDLAVTACERFPVRALRFGLMGGAAEAAALYCWWSPGRRHDVSADRADKSLGLRVQSRYQSLHGIHELQAMVTPHEGIRLPSLSVGRLLDELSWAIAIGEGRMKDPLDQLLSLSDSYS